MSNHFGANYVFPKIIKKFWICSGISTVRIYLSNCQYCKLRRARSAQQVMSDLPECRLITPKFPFEHTDVELFGPISVKRGRSLVKRWGVLFI